MKYRLLFIEDEEPLVNSLRILLPKDRWELASCATGEEGVKKAEELRPDVVILDIGLLGEMDGWEVCRILKSDENLKSIPVLMLTGKATRMEDKLRGFELKADDYLLKPYRLSLLVSKVEALLKGSQRAGGPDKR